MFKKLYLDYAAATPIDPVVLDTMRPYFTDSFYNPSATYLDAKQVSDDIAKARASIASWLGSRPSEIIFTAGGTEANNLAIDGIMKSYPAGNVVISSLEHDSIREAAKRYECREASSDSQGIISADAVESMVDDNTVIISVMYANNEIGTIQPIKRISDVIAQIRVARKAAGNDMPLYFHTDACQAGNYLDIHVSRLGVDMMTLNAGKIYGPKQTGLLYCRTGTPLLPIIHGGGQERNLRSGTESVTNIVGFAKALEIAQTLRKQEAERLRLLQRDIIAKLPTYVSGTSINGSLKQRLPNNIHLTLPGHDNERLIMELDEKGIMCAAGSACSASNQEVSHVLTAIGLSESEARSSLRLSLGRSTTKADLERFLVTLKKIID